MDAKIKDFVKTYKRNHTKKIKFTVEKWIELTENNSTGVLVICKKCGNVEDLVKEKECNECGNNLLIQ